MKPYNKTKTFTTILLLTLIIFSCERKWDNPNDELGNHAIVTTRSINSITANSATSGGNVTADGGATVTARGVCWSTSQNPTITNSHTTNGTGTGSFTSNITGLTASTTYYVRAYATNSAGTSYGQSVSFTTKANLPTVTTNSTVTEITQTTAKSGGNVTSDGGATVTSKGVCWSTSQNPTITGSHTTNGTGTGSFTSNITGLSASTTYYVRAYATNSAGTSYGSQLSFTTSANINLPTVTTTAISSITQTSAVSGGNVTSDGGATVTAKGVCWSTSQNPTISGSHTTYGTGTGSFTSSITGLSASTIYYVRAYAINSAGTSYGSQLSFTTSANINLPTVTTTAISSITQTSAVSGGNVTSDGGATVTAKGVCWSTSQNPTITDSHTTDGTGTGSFTSNITGLTASTTYYVRAYATNSAGTSYGSQLSFTTIGLPTVTTTAISSITQTSAVSGGNVTADGGATVTAKGVCWSTSENPTITDGHTSDGTGTGSFTSSITGLTASTTYYVRAYATNSAGTSYGSQINFTTIDLPTVTTAAISSITENSAVSGGNVTSDGGATVTAKGVCWSTSQNPTTSNSHTTNGTGTGSFTSNITGLSASTTYYVRAYATNSVGTAYGNELEFKTDKPDITGQTGTLTDIDGNTYNWVGIGKQAWMAENLKTTHYADGTEIPLVTDNTAWANLGDNNTDDAYCYYNNNANNESDTYGALYTWAATMGDNAVSSNANPSGVQGVCPDGWHLPSDAEWTELEDYISNDGHSGIEGTALKATSGWNIGNGTDNYGFSALPGGSRRGSDGMFFGVGYYDGWWSSTEYSSSYAWLRGLGYNYSYIDGRSFNKSYGVSVRCVRDN